MKTRFCVLALSALLLGACDNAPRGSHAGYYYPSANRPAGSSSSGITPSIASMAGSSGAPVPRGGYAPGSGPTMMPQGNQFMYQQNMSGPFGSRSSTGVIQSYGGVQSYQTIGSMPVSPGMPIYNPGQPHYGAPSSQPVYVPGVGGAAGYYMNPNTGARVQGP